LGRQLPESAAVPFGFGLGVLCFAADVLANRLSECVCSWGRQPGLLVVGAFSCLFDSLNCGVRVAAGAGGPDAAEAGVVVVVAAELAAVVAVAQAGTADPAVDRAVEIVAVLLGAFPACAVASRTGCTRSNVSGRRWPRAGLVA
jgi:hypothetical protein